MKTHIKKLVCLVAVIMAITTGVVGAETVKMEAYGGGMGGGVSVSNTTSTKQVDLGYAWGNAYYTQGGGKITLHNDVNFIKVEKRQGDDWVDCPIEGSVEIIDEGTNKTVAMSYNQAGSNLERQYCGGYNTRVLAGANITLTTPGVYLVTAEKVVGGDISWVTGLVIVEDAPMVEAKTIASKVIVDGKVMPFDAYNIADVNYFKLRDIATAVSGTKGQFEVVWSDSKKVIELYSGKSYTAIGGELTPGSSGNKMAKLDTSPVYRDGAVEKLEAYNIANVNYFKLRDIGKAFGFNVTWVQEENAVVVNTNEAYVED